MHAKDFREEGYTKCAVVDMMPDFYSGTSLGREKKSSLLTELPKLFKQRFLFKQIVTETATQKYVGRPAWKSVSGSSVLKIHGFSFRCLFHTCTEIRLNPT